MILDELPETPAGWTKRLKTHLNFGKKGGAASYDIFDLKGSETGIIYFYNTAEKTCGYYFNDDQKKVVCETWADLRKRHAELKKKLGK